MNTVGYAIENRFIGSIHDFSISLILFLIFFIVLKKFIERNNLNINLVIGIVLYRLLIFLFMILYSAKVGSFDGHGIYNIAGPEYLSEFVGLNLKSFTGSAFISQILRPLVGYLNMSYISISLIFFYLGTFGVLFCLQIYRKLNLSSIYVKFFVVAFCFNPSLHIFTASLTKDAIIFFITMFIFYIYYVEQFEIKKLLLYSFVSVLIIYFIRPYAGGVMFASILPYYILSMTKINIKKIIVSFLLIILTSMIFIISKDLYAWTHGGTFFGELIKFIEQRQNVTDVGGTSLNYKNGEIFIRFFQSIFGLGVAKSGFFAPVFLYDQILSIYLFLLLIFCKFNSFKNIKNFYFKDFKYIKFFLIYALGLYLICSLSLSNFGLILRIKLMYWPIIIFFIISLFKTNEHRN